MSNPQAIAREELRGRASPAWSSNRMAEGELRANWRRHAATRRMLCVSVWWCGRPPFSSSRHATHICVTTVRVRGAPRSGAHHCAPVTEAHRQHTSRRATDRERRGPRTRGHMRHEKSAARRKKVASITHAPRTTRPDDKLDTWTRRRRSAVQCLPHRRHHQPLIRRKYDRNVVTFAGASVHMATRANSCTRK